MNSFYVVLGQFLLRLPVFHSKITVSELQIVALPFLVVNGYPARVSSVYAVMSLKYTSHPL